MCLKTKDKVGIVADRDIPCIKLLFHRDDLYQTICQLTPVELGKLMVAEGDKMFINYFSNDYVLSEGFIHSYMVKDIKDFHTYYSFDVAVRAYIPKGSVYYVDEDNPYEVCSPTLFVTDKILLRKRKH